MLQSPHILQNVNVFKEKEMYHDVNRKSLKPSAEQDDPDFFECLANGLDWVVVQLAVG